MENLCQRFPHLAGRIFDQVDDQSLNECKEISREVLESLNNERIFWIRIMKKQGHYKLKDFPKFWKLVIYKTPVENVKQIAIAVSQFFQRRHVFSHSAGAFWTQWSLFEVSANHGDLALLQFIVDRIKLKNVRQTERINALFLAAFKGHLEIYDFISRRLREKNPGKTSSLNREGRTPLHWAALKGQFGVCKLIIENTSNKNPAESGCPTSKTKEDGHTPLHLAANNGHLEVCKLIMDNLTDKNPGNRANGETPLHFAAYG